MPGLIYVNVTRADWCSAQQGGKLRTPSLASEGFIHASTPEQIEAVLNRKFSGRQDLLLLSVDTAKLGALLKWEVSARDGQSYPHIYGALSLDAVENVREISPQADGAFKI